MRAIFRKIKRRQILTAEEKLRLSDYAQNVWKTPRGEFFRQEYGWYLAEDQQLYLPAFACTASDLCFYLIDHPTLITQLATEKLTLKDFPADFHLYLIHTFQGELTWPDIKPWFGNVDWNDPNSLPSARKVPAVYKYETNNPNKEAGLKSHFERLARYPFVSRLQSYRYLTKNKVSETPIEVVSPDSLGGIFTNKEKSIYYFIYLTEADEKKAANACRVLNSALYGAMQ